MFYLFIISILVLCLLVTLMFFILRRTVKTINNQTKLYFVDKLQEYDYIIEKKEKQLENIEKEIKEKGSQKEEKELFESNNNYEFDYNIIDLINKTKYQDKNVFALNRKIEEKFNLDYEKIIKEFIKKAEQNNQFEFCEKIKNKFTSDEIYLLKSLTKQKRDERIKEILNSQEYKIYNLYIEINKNNNIDGFIDYLNEIIDLNDPKITVYVGDKSQNFNYIDKNIQTVFKRDIYKGIKIKYHNKIYDYSLNERNV